MDTRPERAEVTVLLQCRACNDTWRLTATVFMRESSRPPGHTCLKCGSHDVKKLEVT